MELLGWIFFSLAFCLLVVAAFFILHYKIRLNALKKEPVPTHDAQKVLAALASSRAILKIDVIDPSDFFWRVPK